MELDCLDKREGESGAFSWGRACVMLLGICLQHKLSESVVCCSSGHNDALACSDSGRMATSTSSCQPSHWRVRVCVRVRARGQPDDQAPGMNLPLAHTAANFAFHASGYRSVAARFRVEGIGFHPLRSPREGEAHLGQHFKLEPRML